MNASLSSSITGLLGFAAAEEQVLLAGGPAAETGTAACWAAVPLVAHNTEFKAQQVHRLASIAAGAVPAEFAEVDHASEDVYQAYAGQPPGQVASDSSRVSGELIAALNATAQEDLLDPARHPWLRGRQLWLQIVVRGFWHPTGHLADYYLAHGRAGRAVALTAHGLATAGYLGAPDQARGMAAYNLACAQAKAGHLEDAAASAREAAGLNPGLRAKIVTEPDLAALRDGGLLEPVLA
jgi:hypothetical protein